MPGPLLAVTDIAPANAAPIVAVIAAISSSAWNVSTSKFLCLASSSRMLLAGVIGYAPRNNRLPLSRAAAIRPIGQRRVAHDAGVLAGRQLRLGNVKLRVDRLDRVAVVIAGLQRRRVRLRHFRLLAELLVDESQRRIQRPIVQPEHQPHREEVAAQVGLFLAQAETLARPADSAWSCRPTCSAIRFQAAVFERIGRRSRPAPAPWRRTRRR